MPGISRKDVDSAGGILNSSSGNVFVDGHGVVRVGDTVEGHGPGIHAAAVIVSGSGSVFVNGIAVCRAGDLASCGDAASGSSDVFAG